MFPVAMSGGKATGAWTRETKTIYKIKEPAAPPQQI
jgi:hypothetical protein